MGQCFLESQSLVEDVPPRNAAEERPRQFPTSLRAAFGDTEQGFLAVPVVVLDLGNALPVITEYRPVRRQDMVRLERGGAVKGCQVVGQGIGTRLGMQPDVGTDPGEQVVTRKEQAAFGPVETAVSRRVPGRPDGQYLTVHEWKPFCTFEQDVGIDHGDKLARRHRCGLEELSLGSRHPVDVQPPPHLEHQVFSPSIARLHQRDLEAMQDDLGAGAFPELPRQTEVVRMDMRDKDPLQAGDGQTGLTELPLQRFPGLVRLQSGINEREAVAAAKQIDIDVSQSKRHGEFKLKDVGEDFHAE